MSIEAQQEVSSLVAAIERRFGVHLCVYDYLGVMAAILPPHVAMHRSSFCRQVIDEHHARCKEFDLTGATRAFAAAAHARGERGGFIKRCHADVLELVMPIVRGQSLVGAIVAGPMRADATDDQIAAPDLSARHHVRLEQGGQSLRDGLPSCDDTLAADLRVVLSAIAARIERLLETAAPVVPADMDRRWRVEALVAHRFMFDLSIADVARELSISESRARHLFIELFGETFSDYLRRVRLKHAEALLVTTDLSIPQVAAASGFNQAAYFHAVFRRVAGMTPMAYRRQGRPSRDGNRHIWDPPQGGLPQLSQAQ